ncbi:MAG TPA: TetR/AcrR family transcriptional regulator [Firmicutes bacterium]|nr:TetR/AcrR family transcriptional regulator [Bacillota bacterium]
MTLRNKVKTDKEKQKNNIIKSAISVLSKKGFSKTTIEDIAQTAGIAKGLIYYYFNSKEEILIESLEFIRGKMKDYVEKTTPEQINSFEKIRVRAKNILKFFSRNHEMFLVFIDQDQIKKHSRTYKQNLVKTFQSQIKNQKDLFSEALQDRLIKPGADPESLAIMLFSMLNMFISYSIISGKKMNPEKIFHQIDIYFLQNLKSTGAE